MPYKDKQKQAENKRQYRENNKEKISKYFRRYRENNNEKLAEYGRQYRENNKEKLAVYHQTPEGKKSSRITSWKQQGIKLPDDYPDWSLFYDEEYMKTTHCEECLVELTESKFTSTRKCLDHCHITCEFRNILCHRCNIRRG